MVACRAEQRRIKVGVSSDRFASFAARASGAVARNQRVISLIDHGSIGQLAMDLDSDLGMKRLAGNERDEEAFNMVRDAAVGIGRLVNQHRACLRGTALP